MAGVFVSFFSAIFKKWFAVGITEESREPFYAEGKTREDAIDDLKTTLGKDIDWKEEKRSWDQ